MQFVLYMHKAENKSKAVRVPVYAIIPDGHNLARVKVDAVHLGNKDGCHSLIEGSPVHVDGGADGEDETGHSLINAQVLLKATEGDWQSSSTMRVM